MQKLPPSGQRCTGSDSTLRVLQPRWCTSQALRFTGGNRKQDRQAHAVTDCQNRCL